jgi:hypothetical protein
LAKVIRVLDFIQSNETLLLGLGIFSVLSFFGTLAFIPWLVTRLPADYFAKPRRDSMVSHRYPIGIRVLLLTLKNLLGVIVVLLGVIMLVIPGQGLLTILIGLILIDFPGKYRLQRSLIQRKPVLRSVNWLRQHRGKPPLSFRKS